MTEDGTALLSIGQLARRTGLTVKTIRYWSDIGAVPPADRTPAGYRLYDAPAVARLELVRTLRELGLGLDTIQRILAREQSVAEVAAVHAQALDAQIRALRLQRAVLRSVADRGSSTEEIARMNKLARLSAEQRNRIVHEFVDDVLAGLDLPAYRAHLLAATPELPEDPTAEQVDAWIELAELIGDPDFRDMVRQMAQYSAEHAGDARSGAQYEDAAERAMEFSALVADRANAAMAAGIAPDSAAAAPVVDELAATWAAEQGQQDSAEFRREIVTGTGVAADPRHERYWTLLAVINGTPPGAHEQSRRALGWWLAALRAHPAPAG
jgi:DNA-binding transcriptional MerR regulator